MNSAARATLVTPLQQYFAIPGDEAALVLDEFEPCVCRGGDWLFRQGDEADCLFLLARGRMQVWLAQSGGQEAGERLVAEVAGTVTAVKVAAGDVVQEGDPLVDLVS